MLAGMITGCIGQGIASPADVVKVRMASDVRAKLRGLPTRYTGTAHAFAQIWATEGWRGFCAGAIPSLQRAAVINGSGIAAYDETKHAVRRLLSDTTSSSGSVALSWGAAADGQLPTIAASMVSGVVSAVASAPFDVIKTRLMEGGVAYRGTLDCAVTTVRREGVLALYKGFTPSVLRLAPWQLVFFLSYEALCKELGIEGV